VIPEDTGEPVATATATDAVDGMPQTGIEDLGAGSLLAAAMAALLILAGLGWALERRS